MGINYKCKGIIFDFNGTMFFDRTYNNEAWLETINSLSKTRIDDLASFTKDMKVYEDIQYSKGILDKLGIEYDFDKLRTISDEKERRYQRIIIEHNDNHLAPGLPELLDKIRSLNIPCAIASMAPEINFDFYLDYLKLDRWFKKEDILYDDYVTYEDKYRMYIDAANKIKLDTKDCLVFEDSPTGARSAIEAGSNNVIMINRGDHRTLDNKAVISRIDNYLDFKLEDYIEF